MYNYHARTPEEWDERTLETCCLKTLPSKINADEHFFKSIAPVLSSFFAFTERAGLLKKSSNLAKRVKKIDKQIVINSNDPSNWGMAKSFVISAQRSGVNIENQKELNEYMMAYNSLQIQSRQAQSQLIQSIKPPTTGSKIGRNEPCPCGNVFLFCPDQIKEVQLFEKIINVLFQYCRVSPLNIPLPIVYGIYPQSVRYTVNMHYPIPHT